MTTQYSNCEVCGNITKAEDLKRIGLLESACKECFRVIDEMYNPAGDHEKEASNYFGE